MGDYRKMYSSDWLRAFHLDGKDHTLKIVRAEQAELENQRGKQRKPAVYFEGKELGLALNKTNGETIAAAYGNDTEGWIGKQIILHPTECDMAGKRVECIRIKIPEKS